MKYRLALILAALAYLALPGTAFAQRAGASDAVLLVASPRLADPSYRQTVVIAVPIDNDRHVGIIINRPTRRTLASLFPEHEPSKRVAEPVFFGGPMSGSAVFAVVRSEEKPGIGSIELLQHLFLAVTVNTVDSVIEHTPNQARYFVGNIVWRPGELRRELDLKLWHVMDPNPDHVFRKDTSGLWEELTRLANAVTAGAGSLWLRAAL
ncbi:MAG: YqgE/AlgH family protein [Betaproteobacteria bacterium]|nr:YqgE/AlgH family protein [Betaproteobacteria bacterium]